VAEERRVVEEPLDRDYVRYLGGGLLLAMNLGLFARAEAFGLTAGAAARISLASAGVWWAATL